MKKNLIDRICIPRLKMAWFLYPFYNMLRLNSTRTMMLGRWCSKRNKQHEDVVTFWANSDHCGDVICGNPIENKKILDGKPVSLNNKN